MAPRKQQQTPLPDGVEIIATKLNKDIVSNINNFDKTAIRFLVKYYYILQEHRKMLSGQISSMDEDIKQSGLLQHFYGIQKYSENEIKRCLKIWTERTHLGQWCQSHVGIGPVITAGLMSNIDINIGTNAAKVTRYCGLDPNSKRVKGQKINYNPDMKRLAWLIGRSFVFNCNRDGADYGLLYKERMRKETINSDNGLYKEQALMAYERIKNSRDKKKKVVVKIDEDDMHMEGEVENTTDVLTTLRSGRLTKSWLVARSARWATKIFLSHYQYVATVIELGREPIRPYAFNILKHADENYIPAYNWPLVMDEKKRDKKMPEIKLEKGKIVTEKFTEEETKEEEVA